jgi:hypothetical protein
VVFALIAVCELVIAAPREVDAERTEALVLVVTAAGMVARSEVEALNTVAFVFALTLVAIPEILVPRDVEALRIVAAVEAVPAEMAAAILVEATVVFALIAV